MSINIRFDVDKSKFLNRSKYGRLVGLYNVHINRIRDMSAHIRTVLTHSDLTMPVTAGKCNLGIWQDIYLWEHRTHSHQRRVIVTVQGE